LNLLVPPGVIPRTAASHGRFRDARDGSVVGESTVRRCGHALDQ